MTWSPSAAVVRDVRRHHEEAAAADARLHAAARRCPGLIETYSRTMLSSPISSVLGSPRYLRSCGTAPTLANGKMRLRAPMVVRPSTTACGPIHVSAADAHVRPDRRRTARCARRRRARRRGATTARRVDARPRRRRQPRTRPRRPRASAVRHDPAEPPAAAPPASASPRAGARRPGSDRAPEARPLDAAQARRPSSSAADAAAPSCASASQSTTPGSTGAPGKWPAKYGSLALTSFVADGAHARLDLERPDRPARTGSAVGGDRCRRDRVLAPATRRRSRLGRARLRWLRRRVVQLDDLVGDVERLVGVEERAARRLEHQRVALLLRRSRATMP